MEKKLRGNILFFLTSLLVAVNALATGFFEVSLSIDLECSTYVMIIDLKNPEFYYSGFLLLNNVYITHNH